MTPRALLRHFADLLFPPRCLFCGELLPPGGSHPDCLAAARAARLTGDARSAKASFGSRLAALGAVLCSFRYTGPVPEAVARFKFRGYPEHGAEMARFMASDLRALFPDARFDCCASVPSYRQRTAHGRDLALEFSRASGIPYLPLLEKTRRTEKQHELPAERRAGNVRDAFAAGEAARGKRVLLVDDVVTSGCTLAACAKALLAAGAASVSAVCFASAAHRDEI